MNASMKVGFIGAGTITNSHAGGLTLIPDLAKVTAVCDINTEAAKTIAEKFDAKVYSSHKEMLANEKLDIALISLPHFLHCPVGQDVLNAGVNLFLEKPMAITVAECRALLECAKKNKKAIFVGQTHQYRTTSLKAKELIRSGAIGEPKIITTELVGYYNWENRKPWFLDPAKAGGGALFNTSPHQADHLLYLIDSPIKNVKAQVSSLRPGQTIDSDSIAFIEYENGTSGLFYVFQGTRHEEKSRLVVKVLGTEGSIIFSPFGEDVSLSKMDSIEKITVKDESSAMTREWIEFISSIKENRPAITDGKYGHNVVAVLEAMVKSSKIRTEIKPDLL